MYYYVYSFQEDVPTDTTTDTMPASPEAVQQIERLLKLNTPSSPPGAAGGGPSSSRLNPFDVLNIREEDIAGLTTEEVTRQYRRLARLLHPDKCDHPDATAVFHLLEKSYQMLRQESVLSQLQRAAARRQEEAAKQQSASRKRGREAEAEAEAPPLGSRSHLPLQGNTAACRDEAKQAEIDRILELRQNDYFGVLDVDPEKEEAGESSEARITKRYRRMAQALHPDKCPLPRAAEAFTRIERAYQELKDANKYIRFKVAFQQQKRKAEALKAARWGGGARGTAAGGGPPRTMEERLALAQRERELEAIRLASEAAHRRKAEEAAAAERAKIMATLQQQRQEWNDLLI